MVTDMGDVARVWLLLVDDPSSDAGYVIWSMHASLEGARVAAQARNMDRRVDDRTATPAWVDDDDGWEVEP